MRYCQSLLIAVVVAALTGVLPGQARRTNTGNVLDASRRVGSYGRNITVDHSTRLNSQLYVDGQVTGLGRFRGSTGYSPSNELRLSLPSESIRNFRMESISARDVSEGRTLGGGRYVDPFASTVSSGTIQRGRNVLDYTGSAGQTSRQVSSPYGTLSLRTNQRLLDDSATLRAALPAGQLGRRGMIDPVSNLAARVEARAGAEAMFGLLRSEDRSSLVRELYDVGYAWQAGRRDREQADGDREALAAERPLPPETPERQWPQPDPDESAEGQADESPPSPEADTLAPGQDTLLDMLAVLRGRSADANAPAPPAGSLPDVEEVLSGQPGAPAANVTVENGEVVVRSLAGRSKDPANSYMRSAERELGSGQFYRASKSFESASLADPRNPLPHVGKGLALLGAGEKVAAASELKEALRGFPQLMDVRVDLGRLLPDQAAKRALEELDSLVAEVDDEKVDGDMLFLATWVQANLGQPARALTYAGRLKGIGRRRDIEFYRVYARNVEEMYGRSIEAGP